jgi:hypothetical protein
VVIRDLLLIALLAVAIRLPFLNQPVQGDDPYYLYGAEHAQIEPLHPNHARYLFQGDLVDMRGHPHPPLNSWILGALLAEAGDIREVPFHLAYAVFSLMAALAMYALARRFCDRPLLAALLFLAVPAFVVNGTSLEADLPLLAFWMGSVAFFVYALEEHSLAALAAATLCAALAGLAAYQAVFLAPVLGIYLWPRRKWARAWIAVVAAPLAIGVWQIWERATSGALPAAVLAGYMQTYGLQALAAKARNAAALVVHSGWLVSPVIVLAGFARSRGRIIAGCAAAIAAAIYDPNPLFWLSVACGVFALSFAIGKSLASRDFLALWIVVFFAGALVVFFAGSARYLLPIAAPMAILAARSGPARALWVGFGLQMALSLALAAANYQHWDAYRKFAESLKRSHPGVRTWSAAEWGLRYYLESNGALPLAKDQTLRPRELIVSSDLAGAVAVKAPVAFVTQEEITPSIPLRLISLSGRSGYSSAARGLLPFEISRAPADRVRAEAAVERKAVYMFLDPRDPRDAPQLLSGIFPDGWMSRQAAVLLKSPGKLAALRVEVYIPPQAPARKVSVLVGGQIAAEDTFPGPGTYALAAPLKTAEDTVVEVQVDRTFQAPGDERQLGVVIRGIGFR